MVGREDVVRILAVVGEHEVEAVAQVSAAAVVANAGSLGELEVDPVAVARDVIVLDDYVPAVPEVNGVAGSHLAGPRALDPIVCDAAARRVSGVDAEQGLSDVVPLDQTSRDLIQPDGGAVFGEALRDVLNRETADRHTIGSNREPIVAAGIDDGLALTDDLERTVDHNLRLVINPLVDDDAIARARRRNCSGERLHWTMMIDFDFATSAGLSDRSTRGRGLHLLRAMGLVTPRPRSHPGPAH